MTKQELRKQIKLSLQENKNKLPEYSEQICKRILDSEVYKTSNIILAYMALSDEVNLMPVIQNALFCKKQVYLPKVDPSSPKMEFYRFSGTTMEGAFGILEPNDTEPFQYDSDIQTLVLVPGRGFTVSGARLGRGKAYYDTYFASLAKKMTLAGVCFNIQLLEQLPVEEHDVFMNLVITENKIINTEI